MSGFLDPLVSVQARGSPHDPFSLSSHLIQVTESQAMISASDKTVLPLMDMNPR